MMRFTGKTVVVTGGGSGIGAATVRRFAQEGANVVLAGRGRERLDHVAADLDVARTLVQICDVADRASVDSLVNAAVARFGGVDIVVANAGVGLHKPFEAITQEEWRDIHAINLDGYFHIVQASIPHLKKGPGSVIAVASLGGLGADWGLSAYNSSKGAMVNLTRALALDLGSYGIRVNAVAPSLTASEMTSMVTESDFLMAKFNNRMPLRGPAMPEDIAGPIAFLASDDARFVTGAILPVDGGVGASSGQPNFMD